jgi:hypothetical protein
VTYNPWQTLADQPNIELLVARLPAGRAWWMPDVQGIVLDDRLSQAERRSALEHELQHVAAGDVCCRVGPDGDRLSRRQEHRTDARAARQLISLDDFADAFLWCLGFDEVAEHLHVDERTVRARIKALTPAEKDYIERRIAAREGAA